MAFTSDPEPEGSSREFARRGLLASGVSAVTVLVLGSSFSPLAFAKDYASKREALDALDNLAAFCGMRLGMLNRARPAAGALVSRFLTSLGGHKARREEARRHFGLPRGAELASQVGEVDADLNGLRQALDDLMVAYAESLPAFGDASVVSRLAEDMVEVSRLRTVIDLWIVAEES